MLAYLCWCAGWNEIIQQLELHFSNRKLSCKEKNISNAFNAGSSHLKFDSISSKSNQGSSHQRTNLNHPSGMGSTVQHHPTVRTSKLNMRPLSNFTSFHKDNIIMAKHQIRLAALGDKCPQDCALDDAECNCRKLFACVTKMTADGECVDQQKHSLSIPVS